MQGGILLLPTETGDYKHAHIATECNGSPQALKASGLQPRTSALCSNRRGTGGGLLDRVCAFGIVVHNQSNPSPLPLYELTRERLLLNKPQQVT